MERGRGALVAGAWLVVATAGACGHDWDPLDPRIGASTTSTTGAGAAGTGGSGATGHAGGTTGGAGDAGGSAGGGLGAGGPGGGGPGGGGGEPTGCNKMSLLADDFEDGDLDPQWVAYLDGGDVTEAGGVATLVSPDAPSSDTWNVLHGERYYDLRDSAVSVRVDAVPASSGPGVWLSVDYDGQNWIEIWEQDGALELARRVDDVYDSLATVAYDPIAHAYWRLREQAGTLYWETSPDGSAYTTQASAPTSRMFPLDLVTSEVGIFKGAGDPGPSFAVFDDYNGGSPTGAYCPVGQLVDDFDDGVWGRIWSFGGAEGGTDVSEIGGALVITPPAAPSSGYGAYYAASSFDLDGAAIVVHVLGSVDAGTQAEMGMGVDDRGDSSAELLLASGTLMFRRWVGGNQEAPLWAVPFDAATQAWWRIREAGGQIVWETSADGAAWDAGGQTASFLDTGRVQPYLFAGTWQPETSPGAAVFDDFDLPP